MARLSQKRADSPGEERDETRFSPIAHLTLYEQVYDKLRDAIMEGAFASGETLTIRGLADQLGTSVMPVREALRRLSTEGALDVLPNRSIRVPAMDAGRIAEICRLRTLLEAEAAALAARHVSAPELVAIGGFHREFVAAFKAGAALKLLRAGQHFHFAIYAAARAPTLLSMIHMLWLQSGPWLSEPLRRTFDKRTVRSFAEAVGARHGEIMEALELRDADRAAEAVCAEMRDLSEHLRMMIAGPISDPGTRGGP